MKTLLINDFFHLCVVKTSKKKQFCNTLVITQKAESQNGCFKKTKHAKFSKKRTFLTPSYVHVRIDVEKDAKSHGLMCLFIILQTSKMELI